MRLAGIVLIILGILVLTYHGIRYTDRDKLIDIGRLKVTTSVKKTFPVPPVVGGIALVAGIGLILTDRRRK